MRFFRFIWRALNNLRRVFQILFMFLIIGLILAGISGQDVKVKVPKSVALVIAPTGTLVEQLAGDPLERAIAEARGIQMQQTLMRDVIDSLELAADDERIKAVVLELDGLGGGGLAKLQAIGDSIERVREAGKQVIAVGDSFSQDQYYLAAHADEIYMHDFGMLFIDGYGYYRTFLKDALDKFKVDVNVFRVGKYKSFVEPFTRNDMSAEDRESSERWLGALWSAYTSDVDAARELEAGRVDAYANNFLQELTETDGNTARAALDAGLIDHLGGRRAYVERVIEIVGASKTDDETFNAIDMGSYLQAMHAQRSPGDSGSAVGILVASGPIVDGRAPRGTIGGDTLAELVSQAADDDSIKALVLRVDSPGGSMFASEVVFGELQRLKMSGKPLVVSMSSTAASGGYYISMPADEIWASETTITGSIGVGALMPTFQRALGSLGITVDGFGTTALAGQFRADRELGEEAGQLFQLGIEEAYRVFLGKVATTRELSIERVNNLARGRVWIGSDAVELGLVDSIGGLDDAVASAAALAGLAEDAYAVEYIEPELTFRERLAMQFAVYAAVLIGPAQWSVGNGLPGWLAQIVQTVEHDMSWLTQLNDPRGLYYHCFCQLP